MSVDISVVIMHHPARRDRIPALLRACLPLRPVVITDPRPAGPPSPLRTAKLAWAAVADGATHHLVLQDDAMPMHGFAGHLRRAVDARPADGVTLYVHWKSPENAYHVRRAAAGGAPWAPMSRSEWTPTLGLVLPAAAARALAAYLAELPDELLDDDDYVTPFCDGYGLAVVATVPHLLEHGDGPSLSGYDPEGERFATVYDRHWPIPDGHWSRSPATVAPPSGSPGYAIELRDSRCLIRFLRPGTDEPLEHPFGWYWYDWCALVGVDAEALVSGWQDWLSTVSRNRPVLAVPPAVALEVWAAGYLLGADIGPAPGYPDGVIAGSVRRKAIVSWIDCGLAPADRVAMPDEAGSALVDLCLAAVDAGRAAPVIRGAYQREAIHVP